MSSNRSVDRATRVGDPFAHAGEARTKAQEELMQAAENVLAFLDDRRDHQPPEMLDGREGRHRKALRAAIGRAREGEA